MKVDRSDSHDPHYVERIHAFDLLRGFFLIVILLDHLAYYPSGLDALTGRGLLYVSSAEGFFLISGIVLGIVRGRKLIKQPISVATKKLVYRSVQLYVTSVILTLIFTFIGWLFIGNPGLKYGILDPSTPLWSILWQAITMQYTYGWADFLRYYALFIIVTPIALWLLRKGYWYIVTLCSAGIWWCYNLTSGGELNAPYAWQFVFISGFTIGFYWPVITRWWRRIFTPRLRATIGISLFCLFIMTACVSAWYVFGDMLHLEPQQEWHKFLEPYFNKDQLPIPRLVLGAIWFWGLFWVVRRFESSIVKYLGWLIMPLGVNSLYVYTVEAFVIFFFHIFFFLPQPVVELAPWYANLALSLLALAIVWIMTKRQILFSVIPR